LVEEMAGKTWVLDTDTKGTGANMVPLEKVLRKQDDAPARPRRAARRPEPASRPAERRPAARRAAEPVETTRTALPPGHVRKRATGEIGQVKAVDPRAGTATVHWLKGGSTSTVPLSAISRR
jgi:hypothetical protein